VLLGDVADVQRSELGDHLVPLGDHAPRAAHLEPCIDRRVSCSWHTLLTGERRQALGQLLG
jgi:hypothetical protein